MAFGLRAVIAGLIVASALGAAPWGAPTLVGPAWAATSGSVSARIEPQGYARIVFAFDRMPGAKARLANGVLVVSFEEPVTFETAELVRGLGALVGVIRRDPDGSAIRMSLTKPVKLVSTEVGENLFVDLLPASWSGLPPPLPREVIAELTREARAARDIRAEEARRRAKPETRLRLDGATHPTFRRLIFGLGGDAQVEARRAGERVVVTIGAPYAFDVAAARATLPPEFAGIEAERRDGGLVVSVPAPGDGAFRGFYEDGDFVLDIDRAGTSAAEEGAVKPAAPSQDQARDDRTGTAERKTAAAAPRPNPPGPVGQIAPAQSVAVQALAAAEIRPGTVLEDVQAEGAAPREAGAKVVAADAVGADGAHAPPATPAAPRPVGGAEDGPSVRRAGETLRLIFPFSRATPAAVFLRGRALWAVFDDPAPLRLDALVRDSGGAILSAEDIPLDRGRAARLKLAEPRLVSAATEGADWIVSIGDDVLQRSAPIELAADFGEDGRARLRADLPGLGAVRALRDPEVGDALVIATLGLPARNVQRSQAFVEFSALATAHGVALGLAADDVRVLAKLDQLVVERDAGLILSAVEPATATNAPADAGASVSAADWSHEVAQPFRARENELMRGAALASAEERPAARLALARFYQARGRAADAKAVLDAIVEDGGLSERDDRLAIMRAAVAVELGRPGAALAVLASPSLRMTAEAALWRAAAEAGSGRPGSARAALRQGEAALAGLPPELQARFVALAVDLALDAGDPAAASAEFERLEVLPATGGFAGRELARARVAEALGQTARAAAAYATLARRQDNAASAEAELRGVELGLKTDALTFVDAIARLERLTTGWRGDAVEAESLARLIALYGDAGRWREAFSTLRVAVAAFPEAEDTRALQDRMQSRFTELFLGSGVDSLPKLDALALFYDFKEMAPGGKRGDELVRRLADKLVEVDLLDQAAELLDYQVENRLTGAARAQVAARAALIDMMNAKPAKALATLRRTRQADLPGSLMTARLKLEARALAETGRAELALEIADGLEGSDAAALRADILWSARRWPEAGEAIEATLGSAWRRSEPLAPAQRADVLRAAIALSLAEDGLGVDRLRQKFAPKMAESPEAQGFEVVTAPIEARGDAFREIARSVAASSAFEGFLREYRSRDAAAPEAEPGSKPLPAAASASGRPASRV